MNAHRVVIVGAGPTGLGAAYRLHQLGEDDFLVVERGDRAGGLAASYVDDQGFTWDTGGHVHFSHYAYFDALMIAAAKDFAAGGVRRARPAVAAVTSFARRALVVSPNCGRAAIGTAIVATRSSASAFRLPTGFP